MTFNNFMIKPKNIYLNLVPVYMKEIHFEQRLRKSSKGRKYRLILNISLITVSSNLHHNVNFMFARLCTHSPHAYRFLQPNRSPLACNICMFILGGIGVHAKVRKEPNI